jgi:hypothetical protein
MDLCNAFRDVKNKVYKDRELLQEEKECINKEPQRERYLIVEQITGTRRIKVKVKQDEIGKKVREKEKTDNLRVYVQRDNTPMVMDSAVENLKIIQSKDTEE